MRTNPSLRRSILFWMALLLLIVGAVSAAVTYEYVKDEAQTSFDAQIRQIAQFLQNEELSESASSGIISAPNPDNLFLIQIWDATGKLIRSSDSTASSQIPTIEGFATQNLGPADWRSFSIIGPQQTIRVSLPLDERNEQASTAALQIAIPMGVIIPLSWLLLSLLIDKIMGGLDRASAAVQNRKLMDATQISTEALPREVVPFVNSINAHVSSLQMQADWQKRFLADAAHELRTPLAALSIQLGNLRTVLRTDEQHSRLAAAEGGSKRANLLVGKLLQLARHDGAASLQNLEEKSLTATLADVIRGLESVSLSRGIEILQNNRSSQDVLVPANDFRQVAEALLENAILHSPPKTAIHVTSQVDGSQFELHIRDQGPGIPPDKLPHVFDRFYRASPHFTHGTGLGLSIAKTICENHGWIIELKNLVEAKGLEAIVRGKSPT